MASSGPVSVPPGPWTAGLCGVCSSTLASMQMEISLKLPGVRALRPWLRKLLADAGTRQGCYAGQSQEMVPAGVILPVLG